MNTRTPSLTHSLTPSLTHSLTLSLTLSRAHARRGFFKPKAEVMPLDLLSIAISMAATKKVFLKLTQ